MGSTWTQVSDAICTQKQFTLMTIYSPRSTSSRWQRPVENRSSLFQSLRKNLIWEHVKKFKARS